MEINLPFVERKIVADKNVKTLSYTAILSRDSLFYAVIESDHSIAHHSSIKLTEVYRSNPLASDEDWKKKLVAFNNPIFTFSSEEEYDPEHAEDLLTFSNQLADIEKYKICSEYINKFHIWIIYAIPKRMISALRSHLGNFDYMHYQHCFLESIPSLDSGDYIKGSIIGNQLNLALFKSGKLIVSNIFSSYNDSEFYYFISLLFDQYDLKAGEVAIDLEGNFGQMALDKNRFKQLFGVFPRFVTDNDLKESLENLSTYMPLLDLYRCV